MSDVTRQIVPEDILSHVNDNYDESETLLQLERKLDRLKEVVHGMLRHMTRAQLVEIMTYIHGEPVVHERFQRVRLTATE